MLKTFSRFTWDGSITGGYSEAARVYGININPEFSIAAAKGDPSTTVERLDKAAIYDEAGEFDVKKPTVRVSVETEGGSYLKSLIKKTGTLLFSC